MKNRILLFLVGVMGPALIIDILSIYFSIRSLGTINTLLENSDNSDPQYIVKLKSLQEFLSTAITCSSLSIISLNVSGYLQIYYALPGIWEIINVIDFADRAPGLYLDAKVVLAFLWVNWILGTMSLYLCYRFFLLKLKEIENRFMARFTNRDRDSPEANGPTDTANEN